MFGVIGLLIVVTAYSALNLENRSDVSLGVYTFRGVPVFLTSLIALILGAVLVVPMTLRRRVRRQAGADDEDEPADAPRRRAWWPFGARRRDQDPAVAPERDRGAGGDRDAGGGG